MTAAIRSGPEVTAAGWKPTITPCALPACPLVMILGGKVIAHSMLGKLVSYQYPDVVLREPPEFSTTGLRDKLSMDYLGGEEVDGVIEEVLEKKTEDISVTKFISAAKQELRELFHITPRKYPKWVQEPEWPMGQVSPMMFMGQRKDGELVEFVFQDADTGEERIVTQYY